MSAKTDYLIIGAGVNGTSIATTLIHLGFTVRILDRSADGYVAPDGASNDLNKIIRADYTDSNYCTLAKEAISLWRTHPVLKRYYHEVGVLFRSSERGKVWGLGEEGSAERYVERGVEKAWDGRDGCLEVGEGMPRRKAYKLERDEQVEELFGGGVGLGQGLRGMGVKQTGYFNPRGGWAEANNACRALLSHAVKQGVVLQPRSTVCSFVTDQDKIVGVRTEDGRTFYGDKIVLAAGAWTSDLLTTLLPPPTPTTAAAAAAPSPKWFTRPSAQCVAILRLTPQQAAPLLNTPVIINFSSGFYQFEPTYNPHLNQHHLKIAYHSNGYLFPKPPSTCSGTYPNFEASSSEAAQQTPTRQVGVEGDEGGDGDEGYDMAERSVPADQLEAMLAELYQIYPSLARQENVVETRICWYSDTLDENWILDTLNHHPTYNNNNNNNNNNNKVRGGNVWVVSGDSGHAYKFLPMIGSLFATVAGLIPNTRGLDLERFTFRHQLRLHEQKRRGGKVVGADSNRVDGKEKGKVEGNARARL
ncbi:related to fructosyl amino acid oxidase [Sporisorium scitamineum]|uniref:Related to fructosyl amino acid oxidase n=1 Tax=Sporisorium scitamineum TaxID=49012 RepID=A0A127ZHD3_9BASI|nr:related to fructosyl amino acid oxidase [Sporisorium scitamineum]